VKFLMERITMSSMTEKRKKQGQLQLSIKTKR